MYKEMSCLIQEAFLNSTIITFVHRQTNTKKTLSKIKSFSSDLYPLHFRKPEKERGACLK